MARKNRTAFTLVEMLVVIVIISMLVALLVPAVIGARERARRASCANNMNQTGKAIIQYETAKQYLPGYVNEIGGGSLGMNSVASNNNLTWPVVILENIGRADLWKEWRKKPGGPRVGNPDYVVTVSEFLCPSDLEKRGKAGALSFAANCGISDAVSGYSNEAYQSSAPGLFFDHDTVNGLPGGASQPVTIGLDGIDDGAQQTIMLSENLDATSWVSNVIADPASDPAVAQADVGIVWWSTIISGVPAQVGVNSPVTNRPYTARPSSNHPGGVNAVYADGHSDFISERVDYTVFRDQMISNQTKANSLGLIP